MMKKILIFLMAISLSSGILKAQNFVIKTNLLYDATATANLGIEFPLSQKWTMDISGNLCSWDVNRHKWKHWLVQPEFRYWFCNTFQGHFLGIHALGGQYNVGNIRNNISFLGSDFSQLTHNRYQGWGAGAGIAYGYSWILSKHWNLEAELGIGWIYTRFDKYPCAVCGTKLKSDKPHNYYGPTKLAINIEYLF